MPFPYRLDRRIKILNPASGTSTLGEPTTVGTEVCSCWAAYRPMRGREIAASGRDVAEAFDTFIIRHRTDINETMQVEFGSDTHQIHRIAEIGRRDGLELTCRRVR